MKQFLTTNQAFMTIAAALSLPFLFALGALSFDLGIGMNNQSRLTDALREASFLSSMQQEELRSEKIAQIIQSYVGKEKEITNITFELSKEQSSQAKGQNDFYSVHASFANNGIFTNFIDPQSKQISLSSKSKLEKFANLSFSDYVFAVPFTLSASEKSALSAQSIRQICSAQNKDLIDHGLCNPPLGSAEAIDATQTIIANIIKLSKSFDSNNNQYFGFIPYGVGAQVRGRDLTPDAPIDKTDGLTRQERDEASYVVWPIEIFEFPEFKNYDYYSRFYPPSILHPQNNLLNERVLRRLRNRGVDTSIFTQDEVGELMLDFFALREDNPLIGQKSDFAKAKEVIERIYDREAIGSADGEFLYIDRTIANIFSERNNFIYRLYDPKVDTLVINASQESLKEAARRFYEAQNQYQSIRADITFLQNARDQVNRAEIDLSGYEEEYKKTIMQAYQQELTQKVYTDYITGGHPMNGDYHGWYQLKDACGESCADEIQFAFEDKKYDKVEEWLEKHKTQLPSSFPQIPPKPTIPQVIPPASAYYVLSKIEPQIISQFQQIQNERDSLQNNPLISLCTNSFTPANIFEQYCTNDRTKKDIERFRGIDEQYKESQKRYEFFMQLKARFEGSNEVLDANLINRYESLASQRLSEMEAAKRELNSSFAIKGKAFCNSIALHIIGAACQSQSGGASKFYQTNLRKIATLDEIKEIDMLNQIPAQIDRQFNTYIMQGPPHQDYASIGLIRSALMLLRSPSSNPYAKIFVFSNVANEKVDEQFFQAGLCQAIKNGLKQRKGMDVEIYAVSFGLPQDAQRIANVSKFQRIWSHCTNHIILADGIDSLLDDISRSAFVDGFGKLVASD